MSADGFREIEELTAFYSAELAIGRAWAVLPVADGPAEVADAAKRLATAKARAAMAGVELHSIEDDGGRPLFICVKWALTASFGDLADVEAWLDRVAGVKR